MTIKNGPTIKIEFKPNYKKMGLSLFSITQPINGLINDFKHKYLQKPWIINLMDELTLNKILHSLTHTLFFSMDVVMMNLLFSASNKSDNYILKFCESHSIFQILFNFFK